MRRIFLALLTIGLFAEPAAAAPVPISGLPTATTPLAGTEQLPVVQSATTKKATVSDIDTYVRGQTKTGSGNLVLATSPALTTPNLGTPSAVTLTNGAGLPISSGVSGLGTGVATALGVNVGSAGAPVLFNGAGGTPSSLTLTNATGLPTAAISNSAVTLAKVASAAANSVLVGSGASGSGAAYTEISLGSGLSMSGTTMSGASIAPQGRLTLASATPVLTSDQTAKSTVYYDCYVGESVPYYNGSSDQIETISSCEVSLTMQASSTGVTNSGGVFDVWWVHSGASRICVATNGSGGGWASDTAGSNTARGTGYSQVHNTRGYWTNVNAISHCYNGTTDYGSVSADQATYLGTLYTTAAGQTGMAFLPSPASGGTNNILGLWNAYNRVAVSARCQDSTASWAYSTATWRATNNSSSNRISFVSGLALDAPRAYMGQAISGNSAGQEMGVSLDSTSAVPAESAGVWMAGPLKVMVKADFASQVGFHYIQGEEYAPTGSGGITYYAGRLFGLYLDLPM